MASPAVGRSGINETEAPDSMPFEQRPFEERPHEERIRQRAFEIYLTRAGQTGSEVEDWLQAEQELSPAGEQ